MSAGPLLKSTNALEYTLSTVGTRNASKHGSAGRRWWANVLKPVYLALPASTAWTNSSPYWSTAGSPNTVASVANMAT